MLRHRFIAIGTALTIGFSTASAVLAQSETQPANVLRALVAGPATTKVVLDAGAVQVLADRDGQLSLDAVRASGAWTQSADTRRCFGFTGDAMWARFAWRDVSADADWLIEISEKSLDSLSLFVPIGGGAYGEHVGGDRYSFRDREIRHRNFVFPLVASGALRDTVYARFATSGPMCMPMTVYSHVGFHQVERKRQFFLGGFFGLLVVMLLFNLLITISIRDRAYLWYVFYIAAYILYQLAVERIAFEYLWPGQTTWEQLSYGMLGILTTVLTIQFSREFLATGHDVRLRFADRVLKVMIWLAIPICLLNWIGHRAFANQAMVVYVLAVTVALTVVAILCLRIKKRPALYYLYAWSFLLLGTVIAMLGYLDVLDIGNLRLRAVQIGAAFELPVLALALGFKYKREREERGNLRERQQAAQRALLVAREKRIRSEAKQFELEARQLELEATHLQQQERLKMLIVLVVHARLSKFIDDIREALRGGDLDLADRGLSELHHEIRHFENVFYLEVTDLDGLRASIVETTYQVLHRSDVQQNVYDDWSPDPEENNLPVPPNVARAALYIVRELATNTRRHSQARTFNLSARHDGDELHFVVWDDGRGLSDDVEREGRGRRDVHRLARLVGGRADGPDNRPEGGVTWLIVLPCPIPGRRDVAGSNEYDEE